MVVGGRGKLGKRVGLKWFGRGNAGGVEIENGKGVRAADYVHVAKVCA